MNYVKIAAILAVLAALAAAAWGVHAWDAGRLRASYEAGEAAERGRWEAARDKAIREAAQNAQSATVAAERAGDAARDQNAASSAQTAKETQSTVEGITDVYADATPPVCAPDGSPVPLPAGVLARLDKARAAALGHP